MISTVIQDLGSASGTFVDGMRAPPNQPTKLHDGAKLTFGEEQASYTLRIVRAPGAKGVGGQKRRRGEGGDGREP